MMNTNIYKALNHNKLDQQQADNINLIHSLIEQNLKITTKV